MPRGPAATRVQEHLLGFFETLYRDVRDHLLLRAKHEVRRQLLEAQHRLVGRSVAVLGPPAAGKTTLLRVFRNPNADEAELTAYEKTEVSANTAIKVNFLLTLEQGQQFRFHFKVKKNADIGGEEYIRDGNWKEVVRGASVVVYVADWQRLSSGTDDGQEACREQSEYRQRIARDFDWILQNTQLLEPGFKVVLVANKIDALCTADNFREFRAEHQARLGQLRSELVNHWPEHLQANMGPALLLSLTSKTLRQFTLNALMLSFVGADLYTMLSESGLPRISGPEGTS
jgi:GTPase SAR1 family protein